MWSQTKKPSQPRCSASAASSASSVGSESSSKGATKIPRLAGIASVSTFWHAGVVAARRGDRAPVGGHRDDLDGEAALWEAAQVDRSSQPRALDDLHALAVDEDGRRNERGSARLDEVDREVAPARAH